LPSKNDVTIILPTLNEEDAIGPVIDELHKHEYKNIIVIDGNSVDKTKQVAEKKNVEFYTQKGKGKADGIKTVLQYVKTPYLLIMDCDYTYDPADIKKFLEKIETANQVIGVRDLRSNVIPKFNQFGNSLITKAYNLVMGADLNDVCCGMYMFQTEFLKKIDIKLTGYQIELELTSKTGEYGKTKEVPINYRKRLGETKMSAVREGFNVFRNLYKFSKVYNPSLLFSVFAGLLIIPGIILLGYVGILWLIDPENYRRGLVQIAIILSIVGTNAIAFALISSHLRGIDRKVNALLWNLDNKN